MCGGARAASGVDCADFAGAGAGDCACADGLRETRCGAVGVDGAERSWRASPKTSARCVTAGADVGTNAAVRDGSEPETKTVVPDISVAVVVVMRPVAVCELRTRTVGPVVVVAVVVALVVITERVNVMFDELAVSIKAVAAEVSE